MRQKIDKEIETRKTIRDTIEANVLTSRIVYPSPSRMADILKADGIRVTKQTLYTAYEQLGIRPMNGLWIKDI